MAAITSPPRVLDNAVTSIHAHGLDEASHQLASFLQVRYVQLERGIACARGAVARVEHMTAGRVGADRDKVERLDVPAGLVLIVVPVRGHARLGAAGVEPGQAIVAHGPTQLILYTDNEYRSLFLTMPGRGAGKYLSQEQAATGVARARILCVLESRARVLRDCVHRVVDDAARESSMLASSAALMQECDVWLSEAGCDDVELVAPTARCQAAVRARQFIDEHLDQPMTLASVCHASYSSARALEYGFREVFGVSPIAYIRCARLSRVRHELYVAPHASGKITQLAMKWGFWHLSQFSKDYYDLFGELPSTTLGRASGRIKQCSECNCTRTPACVAAAEGL